MREKQAIETCGAIDTDPAKVGRDLGEVVGPSDAPWGLKISADAGDLLDQAADVVIHSTSSSLPKVMDQLLACMNPIYRRIAQIPLVCAVLSLVGLEAQAQTYVFGTASYSAPGGSSTSPRAPIVTADFNRDGIPDVAILGSTSGDRSFQSFWAGQTDLSLRERIMQFRQPASRLAISMETASSTSSLSATSIHLGRAFFWETGMEPSNLPSH
jgi:hypothetical protein